MSEPKKHHFSPVFYLKWWCNSDSEIVEYSRPYRDIDTRTVSPEATGFKHFLYTLDGVSDDQKQVIEKNYMSTAVDNPAAIAMKILIERDKTKLTEKARSDWTRFLMASWLRRPQAVSEAIKTFTGVMEKNLNADPENYKHLKEGDPATPFEWIQQNYPHLASNAGKSSMMECIEDQKIGNTIINMNWSTVDLHKSKHSLLTSDSPTLRTAGLKEQNCLIALPLSPRFLFIATHDKKIESAFLAQGETLIAKFINDNVVRAAEKYAYAQTDRYLRFVENRLCIPGSTRSSVI